MLKFPVTNKLIRTVETPWLKAASVTMLNKQQTFLGSDFLSAPPYPSNPTAVHRVGGGVFQSYTGSECAEFIANGIRKMFLQHPLKKKLEQNEMITFAMATDADFCMRYGGVGSGFGGEEEKQQQLQAKKDDFLLAAADGCRGSWFVAEYDEKAAAAAAADAKAGGEAPPGHIQLWAANVGNSRVIGISNDLSQRCDLLGNVLDHRKLLPLSVDHRPTRPEERRRITLAGGTVNVEQDLVDENPFINVSRTFGHASFKNNMKLSPRDQKLTAFPDVFGWTMRPGEVAILATHSAFETRGQEPNSVDTITDAVQNALKSGGTPADAAGAVCDLASSYGSCGPLAVQVICATDLPALDASAAESTASPSMKSVKATRDFVPGTLYPSAVFGDRAFREALRRDAEERLDLVGGMAELLRSRWYEVKDILPHRHNLNFKKFFPIECGMVSAMMTDEAEFFNGGPSEHELRVLKHGGVPEDEAEMHWFREKASSLFPK